MACPCCGPRCCCEGSVFRFDTASNCSGSSFAEPSPRLFPDILIEWCSLTNVITTKPGSPAQRYDLAETDYFECGTNVLNHGLETADGLAGKHIHQCGFYINNMPVYAYMRGFVSTGVGIAQRFPRTEEVYLVSVSQCFDGGNLQLSVTLSSEASDNGCGYTGNYAPCNHTPPEITVLLAP